LKNASLPNSYEKYMKTSCTIFLASYLTNADEIINVAHTIKPAHSSGLGSFDPMIALPHVKFIARSLLEIISCSFTTWTVPLLLKSAIIMLVFK